MFIDSAPDWLWKLVAGLEAYEETHGMLYGPEGVKGPQEPCTRPLLDLIPVEVRDTARAWMNGYRAGGG